MKNWTKSQIIITCVGYFGLFVFGYGYLTEQHKLKNKKDEIEAMKTEIASEKNNYSHLEHEYEDMAHELDSLYFVVDVDGSLLKEIMKNSN